MRSLPLRSGIIRIWSPPPQETTIIFASMTFAAAPPRRDVSIESRPPYSVEPAAFTKISTLGIEEQRVNVLVDILSPPEQWARLGDAYRVDAAIVVFTKEDAPILSSGALFRRGDTWNVFVVSNGRAELREVRLLRRSGRSAAIASGVTAGDAVIVYPSDRIAPGVRVAHRAR